MYHIKIFLLTSHCGAKGAEDALIESNSIVLKHVHIGVVISQCTFSSLRRFSMLDDMALVKAEIVE